MSVPCHILFSVVGGYSHVQENSSPYPLNTTLSKSNPLHFTDFLQMIIWFGPRRNDRKLQQVVNLVRDEEASYRGMTFIPSWKKVGKIVLKLVRRGNTHRGLFLI